MKRLLRDRVVQTTFYMILLTWGFSACSAVTGVWLSRRHVLHHLSAEEIKHVWQLPILLTILWTPIILWRASRILRVPATSSPSGAVAGREATNTKDQGAKVAPGCFYIGASLLLFFGIAMACNFAGDPQRWRVGVIFLAVSALPFAIIFFRRIWLRRAIGRAELHLETPIHPGFSGTARYVRPLRGAVLKNVTVRLSCEKQVTKHFGRIWIPTKRVLYEETITPQVTPSAERIDIKIHLHIPPSGSRSMSTDYETITWWLRLRLEMSGCPNTSSAFAIEVV
jgi:hypothetical protein